MLESHLPSADLLLLGKGYSLFRHVGLAGGYPVALHVIRDKEGDTLGVYMQMYMPAWEGEDVEDVIDGVDRGMGFECCVRLSDRSFSFKYYSKGDCWFWLEGLLAQALGGGRPRGERAIRVWESGSGT